MIDLQVLLTQPEIKFDIDVLRQMCTISVEKYRGRYLIFFKGVVFDFLRVGYIFSNVSRLLPLTVYVGMFRCLVRLHASLAITVDMGPRYCPTISLQATSRQATCEI